MSLNRTLDRLFEEIRREAKRNPEFADRLDAVLRLHDSRRDVPDEAIEEAARAPASASEPEEEEAPPAKPRRRNAGARADGAWTAGLSPAGGRDAEPGAPARTPAVQEAPAINPAGLYKREGEEALREALESQELGALRALVVEHNLDPSGVTPSLTRDELAAHILTQAKRRAERDERMFDY